jgi:1,4-alpha-glucan branching enzyme
MNSAILEPNQTAPTGTPSSDERGGPDQPVSIYEVHPGSWMRVPEENNRPLTCAEIAPKLADHVKRLNFTHVELLLEPESPVCRSRDDLTFLIQHLHQSGLGVILDLSSSPALFGKRTNGNSAAGLLQSFHADGVHAGNATALVNGSSNFILNWDLARRRDLLDYFATDPLYRKFRHLQLLSRDHQAPAENVIVPFSHETVALGKQSLLAKMPGDEWQKFANLRLLFAFIHAQPGRKLLFMGGEFGQWNEWNPDTSLDWHLVRDGSRHQGLQNWVADLNRFYRSEAALHQTSDDGENFEWVDASDAELSTFSWLRHSRAGETLLIACNCTPVPRHNYRVGVPAGGLWLEMLNSDARQYGGSGQGNLGGVEASPFGWHSRSHSLTLTLPPLGAVFFKRTDRNQNP